MGEIELLMSVFFIPVTGSNFVDRLLYSLDFCQNDTLCCYLSQAQKDLQVSQYVKIMPALKALAHR